MSTPQIQPEPPPSDDAAPTRLNLAPNVSVAESSLRFDFVRGRGPGGQSVNKLATTAQLRLPIAAIRGLSPEALHRLRRFAGSRLTDSGELLIVSRTHRSQLDNRRACIDRLRDIVQRAVAVPAKRKPTKPTRAMIRRRLDAKRRHSEKKNRRRGDRPDPRDH